MPDNTAHLGVIDGRDSAPPSRGCTCHPDDNPLVPCPQKFAYSECLKAAKGEDPSDVLDEQEEILMLHPPTPEQEACIQAASVGGSLMISAYAGTAKSTTLEMMAPRVREPALALAFNRKIAQELDRRLPGNFSAKTLNGLGHGAWIRGNREVLTWTIEDRKLSRIVTEIIKAQKTKWLWEPLMSAVRAAMNQGLIPTGIEGKGLIEDSLDSWRSLALEVDEEDLELVAEMGREVLRQSIQLAREGRISFDDQIYCPTLLGGVWPKFPIIFGDEVQDWSPMNLRQVELCVRVGGRLALVGDQRQSIYLFRGADSESMEKSRRLAREWTDLPLTLTFRCPKLIVERQQEHAPGYRAWERNPEGRFEVWKEWGPSRMREPLTVLCRNTAPLLKLAFRLLRNSIGCQVAGRDIGRGLISLSRKICPSDETPSVGVVKAIQEWRSNQIEIAIARDQMEKLESIEDRSEALQAVLDSSGAQTAGDLRRMLEQLFARESGMILLSTIHRAKGLEWERVLHLDPWRLPSKYALRTGGAALEQEANLKYVCETRTRDLLVEARMDDWRSGG